MMSSLDLSIIITQTCLQIKGRYSEIKGRLAFEAKGNLAFESKSEIFHT